MLLFIDTETQGLPDFNKRASDPAQPHIVQLAALLTDDEGKVIESHNVIVKPEGWIIPDDVAAIHGISHTYALEVGVPERAMAEMLWPMLKKQSMLVAHNIQFDKFMARIAMRRQKFLTDDDDAWWKGMPTYCTMRETTELCQLPSTRGYGYKWPKLEEAFEHIFRQKLDGAHDAMVDVTACKEIYFHLRGAPVAN